MAGVEIRDPFLESAVEEVHLEATPLQSVLFQATFPKAVASLKIPTFRERLTESLAKEYPYAEEQPIFQVVIRPGQAAAPAPTNSSAYVMTDDTQTWTLNVADDNLSLATTAYTDREDFLQRSRRVFDAVALHAAPPAISRLGLRYINRISGDSAIEKFVPTLNSAVRSVRDIVSQSTSGSIQHLLTDLSYLWPEGKRLQARWGQLPPLAVHDGLLVPLNETSWILDIDAVIERPMTFSPEELENSLRDLSERSYRLFRWVFTDDALKQFGSR